MLPLSFPNTLQVASTSINVKSDFTILRIVKIPPYVFLSKIEQVNDHVRQSENNRAYPAPAVDPQYRRPFDLFSEAGTEKPRESGYSHKYACQRAAYFKNLYHKHTPLKSFYPWLENIRVLKYSQ